MGNGAVLDFLDQNYSNELNLLLCWVGLYIQINPSIQNIDCGTRFFGNNYVANQNYCSKLIKVINSWQNEKPFSNLYGPVACLAWVIMLTWFIGLVYLLHSYLCKFLMLCKILRFLYLKVL